MKLFVKWGYLKYRFITSVFSSPMWSEPSSFPTTFLIFKCYGLWTLQILDYAEFVSNTGTWIMLLAFSTCTVSLPLILSKAEFLNPLCSIQMLPPPRNFLCDTSIQDSLSLHYSMIISPIFLLHLFSTWNFIVYLYNCLLSTFVKLFSIH